MERQDAEPWAHHEYELYTRFVKEFNEDCRLKDIPMSQEEFIFYFQGLSERCRLSETLKWSRGYDRWNQEINSFPDDDRPYDHEQANNETNDFLNRMATDLDQPEIMREAAKEILSRLRM